MKSFSFSNLLSSNNILFRLPKEGKRIPNIYLSSFVLLVILVAGSASAELAQKVLLGEEIKETEPWGSSFFDIMPFILFVGLLHLWLRFYERRKFSTIGLISDAAVKKFLIGFLVGLVMISVSVGIIALTGNIVFDNNTLQPTEFNALSGVLFILLFWILQSSSEEILFRGWHFNTAGARYKPLTAIIVSSLLFTLAHYSPDGTGVSMLNITLFAVFLSLYSLYEESIWGICGWHASWNWAQGNLFGLSVTNTKVAGGTILNLKAIGPNYISGGSYGPEGSIFTTVIFIAGIIIVVFLSNKKKTLQ